MIQMEDTFGPALERFSSSVTQSLREATEKNANLLHAKIVKGIRSQNFRSNSIENWKDLSLTYIRSPRKKNSLLLVNEGDYSGSFEVEKLSAEDLEVGTNHPAALALEFGYEPRNLPARPHVRVGMEQSAPQMLENWREALSTSLGGNS